MTCEDKINAIIKQVAIRIDEMTMPADVAEQVELTDSGRNGRKTIASLYRRAVAEGMDTISASRAAKQVAIVAALVSLLELVDKVNNGQL